MKLLKTTFSIFLGREGEYMAGWYDSIYTMLQQVLTVILYQIVSHFPQKY